MPQRGAVRSAIHTVGEAIVEQLMRIFVIRDERRRRGQRLCHAGARRARQVRFVREVVLDIVPRDKHFLWPVWWVLVRRRHQSTTTRMTVGRARRRDMELVRVVVESNMSAERIFETNELEAVDAVDAVAVCRLRCKAHRTTRTHIGRANVKGTPLLFDFKGGEHFVFKADAKALLVDRLQHEPAQPVEDLY